ncbi:Crp/Fnr family transcriptional regulator [Neptunitalea lumnitzerae]|uniref:Crp/Fnr family transcriptional regulator n=1 Tax=Neptunitalea lumnitzerae TaxID=2965509 RepID=A0ABQ5MKT5_9FLAO|nr:Crp/Fnr family transcriptional regulator [Neptunitalea sp. Y10]GLB50018.1 Crp/Fnr family transcriptional regulator [Neptunitalea sp. Y10]
MSTKFINYISSYIKLTNQELKALEPFCTIITLQKNELLFKEGAVANELYFLNQGAIRLFYNVDGNEKTAFFYLSNQFICAGESYTYQTPSSENFQAIENSEVIIFKRKHIEKLLASFPKFEIIARIAVETELINYQHMVKSFITKSPEERYIQLLQNNKELFQKVPQQYIATYLGVSPETLSRIKKRTLLKIRS